jgi:hypothetical protein
MFHVIDTFHSNKEIFPMDLISNASMCVASLYSFPVLLHVFFVKDAWLISRSEEVAM